MTWLMIKSGRVLPWVVKLHIGLPNFLSIIVASDHLPDNVGYATFRIVHLMKCFYSAHKKTRYLKGIGFLKNAGGVLLSHLVTQAVPSALKSLTAVFGMGTGVTSSLSPPKTVKTI